MLALWLGGAGLAHGKTPAADWKLGPVPGWVQPVEGPADPGFASAHPSSGLAYEEIDSQRRIVKGEDWSYVRVKLRVVTEAGTEAAGQQSFDFSPPNERLILHSIRVHRDGEVKSRLSADAVQLLQREANLDALVYDNQRTAFILLPDLRVGDVLEYDWSIVRANPSLGDHIAVGVSTRRGVAVGAASSRVLADRKLALRGFGGAQVPTARAQGRLYEYTMREESVAATPSVENVPAEAQLVPWVQFSDFESWAAVARWGTELFALPEAQDAAVVAVAAQLDMSGAMDSAKILAVLRWVQSEVRYFSLPFAESTHRPAAPGTVLERRYGDCKDKALLTVALLRELGVPAHVALVDIDDGRFLPEMLPTIGAFDHAIVVAQADGEHVWIDPTSSYQRGSLEHVAARGLHWALPLLGGTDALVSVNEPTTNRPHTNVHANYDASSFETPATLDLRVEHTGAAADVYRYLHATQDPEAFTKIFEEGFEANLRELHADAESLGDLEYEDQEMNNRVVLKRAYSIPGFWKETDGQLEVAVAPFSLYGEAPNPEPGREAPLAVSFPSRREHHATIDLPKVFEVEPDETRVEEGPLRYSFSTAVSGQRIELDWSMENIHHRLDPDGFEAYAAALATVDESFSFYLWDSTGTLQGEGTFNWTVFMVGVMWALMLSGVAVWVLKRGPHLRTRYIEYNPTLVGLGGWLILVGFALIVAIPRVLHAQFQTIHLYSNESWAALTSPTSADYESVWAPILFFELLANTFILVLTVTTIIAFFKRHRSFSLLFIAMHVSAVLLPTIDDALAGLVTEETISSPKEVVLRWVRGVLWVAYGLRSARIRSTFLPRPESPGPSAPNGFGPP